MNKLLGQIKLHSRSLTIRVVFVMILLVIPLNIWGIFTVSRMQDYMYTEVRNSIYSIGHLKMSDLDARMISADIYLMDTLMNENSFFSTVLSQKGDAAFYHALYNVHSSLQSRLAPGNDADGYFLYVKDLDYSDVVFRHQQVFNQEAIQEGLDALIGDENYQISRQWVLVSYEGELWLMRCVHRRNIYYGAFIDVQNIYSEMYGSLGYETVGLEMTSNRLNQNGNDGSKVQTLDREDRIVTVCNSENADVTLYISVDKQEITRNLPVLQRAGVGISLVFCLALPIIILFLYRWLLNGAV